MEYASNNIRNILIAGHAGSGKTTLTEALVYFSGAAERMGRVEDGTTISDFDPEEAKRKASLSASVVPVEKIITATCEMANRVTAEPATTATSAETEAEEKPAMSAEAEVKEDGGRYHLIVATFNTRQEADKYVRYNATAEYPLTIISTSTKSRVSVMSSDDRSELVRGMHQKGIKERFSEPWIWEK